MKENTQADDTQKLCKNTHTHTNVRESMIERARKKQDEFTHVKEYQAVNAENESR